tara:strand:+ start:2613 stop:3323 length:711 start_codon:yes stop_codon:yes gene_type:complete
MAQHKSEEFQKLIKKPPLSRYAEGLTQDEIKKLVEAEVGTQIERLKDYYRRGYPTFEITGGNDLKRHDLAEFQLDTESGQGILFTNTGNAKVVGNASLELISDGIKTGKGGFDKDGEAGIVIYAKDGVIHIESVRGTVNIKARKNIQLQAGEDINLIAGKDIKLDAGEDMIHEVGGDYTEDVTDNKRIVCTGTMTLHSEKQDIETSCGTDPTLYEFHEDLKTEWEIVKEIADSPNN